MANMIDMLDQLDRNAVERTFTISELAEEFQVTARTIRFYEDQGLISPRREGLNRIYTHRDRGRLVLICRGKRLGFSLAEIKDFLDLYEVDDRQIEQMKFLLRRSRDRQEMLRRQLEDVKQTLSELGELEKQITAHLSAQGVPSDAPK
jgi:DNA-binding transcriptional MerR regulator